MRLNFELDESQMDEINALKRKTGANSMKELFDSVYYFGLGRRGSSPGKEIVATSPDDENHRGL